MKSPTTQVAAAPSFAASLRLSATTWAVSLLPSEKVTPERSVKLNWVAFAFTVHFDARNGRICPVAGSCSVSVSKICRVTYSWSLPLPPPHGEMLSGSLASAHCKVPPDTGMPAAAVEVDEAPVAAEPEGAADELLPEEPQAATTVTRAAP